MLYHFNIEVKRQQLYVKFLQIHVHPDDNQVWSKHVAVNKWNMAVTIRWLNMEWHKQR